VLVALHAVMVMLDRGQKGKVAGLCLGGLCALCLAVRSKDMLMYHGLAGARAYLESKGLGVLDIGTAVVVYEALGFVLMVAFWLWCWVVQPVKLGLVQPFGEVLAGNQMVARVAAAYEGLVEKAGSKFGWVADRLKLDPTRLTTSVRPCCSPLRATGTLVHPSVCAMARAAPEVPGVRRCPCAVWCRLLLMMGANSPGAVRRGGSCSEPAQTPPPPAQAICCLHVRQGVAGCGPELHAGIRRGRIARSVPHCSCLLLARRRRAKHGMCHSKGCV